VTESDGQVVMFIDEIHTVVGAGATSGSMDASNLLKPMLARGELRCIGATTLNEYKQVRFFFFDLHHVYQYLFLRLVEMCGNQVVPIHASNAPSLPRLCVAWQNMEKDKALERRFQQGFVKQPNVEDTVRAKYGRKINNQVG